MASIASQYSGKTLNQIRDAGMGFRPDVLGSFLGISESAPLSADTIYNANLPQNYQNSSEGNAFRSIFSGNDTDIISRQQAAAQQKALTARQQAIAPAVQSLEASIPEQSQKFATERTRLQGEVDPIKQRYQTVLDELKRRETRDTGEVNTSLAREFGRRGIPLSSGLYEETGIEKRRPISEFYGIQGREAGASQEENLRNITNLVNQLVPQETEANRTIRNAIAQLQSGAGNASIEDAFNQLRFQEEQRQYQQNYTLQQAQQAANEKLQAAQIANYNKPEKEDLSKNYVSIGEGNALYDVKTGKLVFTNPKTYKNEGGGGGSETQELQRIFGTNNEQSAPAYPSYFKPLSQSNQRYEYYG